MSHASGTDVFAARCERRATKLTLTLPFEARQKARQRAILESGREVWLKLPRGGVLRDNDCLINDEQEVLQICAAPEAVSVVTADEPILLARVAYHLGNRHVWVEVGSHELAYLSDHVLDAMVEGLGARVCLRTQAFEPEAGAYLTHNHD